MKKKSFKLFPKKSSKLPNPSGLAAHPCIKVIAKIYSNNCQSSFWSPFFTSVRNKLIFWIIIAFRSIVIFREIITLWCFRIFKNSIKFQDTSPLSNYVMHPFWNNVVKLFPRWIAPNCLTLCGFLFLVSQTILLWSVDPKLERGGETSDIPSSGSRVYQFFSKYE